MTGLWQLTVLSQLTRFCEKHVAATLIGLERIRGEFMCSGPTLHVSIRCSKPASPEQLLGEQGTT